MSSSQVSSVWQWLVGVLASLVMAFLLWDRSDMREDIVKNEQAIHVQEIDSAVIKNKLDTLDRRTEEILRELRDQKRAFRGN